MELQKCPEWNQVDVTSAQIRTLGDEHWAIIGSYLGNREKYNDEQLVQTFAYRQGFGFAEDFLQAVKGGEEAYRSFVSDAVQRNPHLVARVPALIEYVDDDVARDAVLNHCLVNERVYENIDLFSGLIPQEKIDIYLRIWADTLHPSRITVPMLGRWVRAGYKDVEKLRKQATKVMTEEEFAWHYTNGYERTCEDLPGYEFTARETVEQVEQRFIADMDTLVNAGVVTWDEVEDNLVARTDPDYYRKNTQMRPADHHGDFSGQYAEDAHKVLTVLLSNARARTTKEQYLELTKHLIEKDNRTYTLSHIWGIDKDHAWPSGTISREFVNEIADYLADVDDLRTQISRSNFYAESGKHEKAQEIANTLIDKLRAEVNLDDIDPDKLKAYSANLFRRATNITAEERNLLILKWAKSHHEISLKFDDGETWHAPQDDEDYKKEILDHVKTLWTQSLYLLNFQEVSEYTGVPIQELKELVLMRSKTEGISGIHVYDSLAEQLITGKATIPVTKDELYEGLIDVVTNNIDEFASAHYDKYYANKAAKAVRLLGKKYAESFIQVISGISPELTLGFSVIFNDFNGYVEKSLNELIARDDYYCFKSAIYMLEDVGRFCDTSLVSNLIETAIRLFDPADLLETAYYAWPYMSNEQLEKLDCKIAKNSAEYDTWLTFRKSIPYFYKKVAELELRASASSSMTEIAPKTLAHQLRRLHGRISHERNGYKVLAQYSYAEELAGYLRAGVDPTTLLAATNKIRAKTEKDELRRLEILYIACKNSRVGELVQSTDINLTIEAILKGPFLAVGLDNRQVNQLFNHFKRDNLELAPLAIWVEQSLKSTLLSNYMREFLTHYSEAGSLRSWKEAVGHRLLDKLGDNQKYEWLQGDQMNLQIAGQQVSLKISHDLDAVYLSGAKPNVNCVHYGQGLNRHGLADLLNPHVAILEVRNAKGSVQLNTVLRLVEGNDGSLHLMMEPIYDSYNDYFAKRETYRALAIFLFQFADKLGVRVRMGGSWRFNKTFYHLTKDVLRIENVPASEETANVYPGLAPFNYDDGAGIYRHKRQDRICLLSRVAMNVLPSRV